VRVLNKESLRNIVTGATLYGAGGGGSPKDGLDLVEKIFEVREGVKLVDPSEISDETYVAMIAGIGAPKALREKGFDVEAIYAFDALKRLYDSVGIELSHLMPGEIGGFNTITPMYVAAVKDLPVVDADGNGRAVPELATCLYPLYRIPLTPLVLADKNGNIVVFYPKDPFDARICEDIARSVTVTFGMIAAFGTWVVSGAKLRESLVLNSVTKCEEVGKAINEAVSKGADPVKAAVEASGGYELIRGEITDISTKTVAGFDFGRTTIEGIDEYSGKKLIIDFKNENMIAWNEKNEPVAMVPDLICLMTLDGSPLTNADTEKGMKIAVIGIPANEKWRKHPKGYEVWTHILEKMGYTGPYKPIEELVK